MTEAAPVAEQQPTPETSVLQQHTLHARLLYAPACNPAERGSPVPTEEQLMHADHAFIDGCVRNACGQACLAHTPEYTAQNTYEQVLNDWKQQLVAKMRQQCNVETEQGRKAIEAYQRLGIRADAFDMEAAQQVYEQYCFRGDQRNRMDMFVNTVVERFSLEEMEQYAAEIEWLAHIGGEDLHAEGVLHTAIAKKKQLTDEERRRMAEHVRGTNEDDGGVSNFDQVSPEEAEILQLWWDNRPYDPSRPGEQPGQADQSQNGYRPGQKGERDDKTDPNQRDATGLTAAEQQQFRTIETNISSLEAQSRMLRARVNIASRRIEGATPEQREQIGEDLERMQTDFEAHMNQLEALDTQVTALTNLLTTDEHYIGRMNSFGPRLDQLEDTFEQIGNDMYAIAEQFVPTAYNTSEQPQTERQSFWQRFNAWREQKRQKRQEQRREPPPVDETEEGEPPSTPEEPGTEEELAAADKEETEERVLTKQEKAELQTVENELNILEPNVADLNRRVKETAEKMQSETPPETEEINITLSQMQTELETYMDQLEALDTQVTALTNLLTTDEHYIGRMNSFGPRLDQLEDTFEQIGNDMYAIAEQLSTNLPSESSDNATSRTISQIRMSLKSIIDTFNQYRGERQKQRDKDKRENRVEKEIQHGPYTICSGKNRGKVKEDQQDECVVHRLTDNDKAISETIMLLADGTGDTMSGDTVSTHAQRIIYSDYEINRKNGDTVEIALMKAIQNANTNIHNYNRNESTNNCTKVTVAVLNDNGDYVVASVGDARVYRILDNRVVQLTKDSTTVLGHDDNADINLAYSKINPEEQLLLCTDGVWGMVTDDTIHQLTTTVKKPKSAVQNLIRRANRNGGNDNMGMIIAKRTM